MKRTESRFFFFFYWEQIIFKTFNEFNIFSSGLEFSHFFLFVWLFLIFSELLKRNFSLFVVVIKQFLCRLYCTLFIFTLTEWIYYLQLNKLDYFAWKIVDRFLINTMELYSFGMWLMNVVVTLSITFEQWHQTSPTGNGTFPIMLAQGQFHVE